MTHETALAEYSALRATIRERGTARICATLAGLLIWAALAVGLTAGGEAQRAVTVVPFVALLATFEVSFFLHTSIERIGRYLQVFYESQGLALSERSESQGLALSERSESKGWEHTIMDYGRQFPGGADPLFVNVFFLATSVDFFVSGAAAALRPGWIAISLGAHVALVWRLFSAKRIAAQQRAADFERFTTIQKSTIANSISN